MSTFIVISSLLSSIKSNRSIIAVYNFSVVNYIFLNFIILYPVQYCLNHKSLNILYKIPLIQRYLRKITLELLQTYFMY